MGLRFGPPTAGVLVAVAQWKWTGVHPGKYRDGFPLLDPPPSFDTIYLIQFKLNPGDPDATTPDGELVMVPLQVTVWLVPVVKEPTECWHISKSCNGRKGGLGAGKMGRD